MLQEVQEIGLLREKWHAHVNLLVKEYKKITKIAKGESLKHSGFNIHAENIKITRHKIVNRIASQSLIFPVGISLFAVLGLRASIFLSIILLKPKAAALAVTIAKIIQNIFSNSGIPPAASMAPVKAKGRANTLCSIFIIFK